uniref:Uncharacterized protein n=1 Tax=Arundo donax TaxID=35708 RepID=A0A0A9C038_ARUDO
MFLLSACSKIVSQPMRKIAKQHHCSFCNASKWHQQG